MKMSLLLIPEMGFHPTDTANSIAGRCTKVPKQMGECRYLIFQWVIHGLFLFPSHCLPVRSSLTVCLCLIFFCAPLLEMCIFQFCSVAEPVMEYKNSWWWKRRLSKRSLMLFLSCTRWSLADTNPPPWQPDTSLCSSCCLLVWKPWP